MFTQLALLSVVALVSASPVKLNRRTCSSFPSGPDRSLFPSVLEAAQTYGLSDDSNCMLALFSAGIEESGFNNLECGEGSRHGFLQQECDADGVFNWGSVEETLDPVHAAGEFVIRCQLEESSHHDASWDELARLVTGRSERDIFTRVHDLAIQYIEEGRTILNGFTHVSIDPSEIHIPLTADREGCDFEHTEIIPNCLQAWIPQPGNICKDVESMFSVPLDDFLLLNPCIDSLCHNLFAGKPYCLRAF